MLTSCVQAVLRTVRRKAKTHTRTWSFWGKLCNFFSVYNEIQKHTVDLGVSSAFNREIHIWHSDIARTKQFLELRTLFETRTIRGFHKGEEIKQVAHTFSLSIQPAALLCRLRSKTLLRSSRGGGISSKFFTTSRTSKNCSHKQTVQWPQRCYVIDMCWRSGGGVTWGWFCCFLHD